MCSPEELLGSDRGVVVAAAGCGKTHLIAESVASQASGRHLILTHTHAGVRALGKKLKALGASSNSYLLTTIASWSLMYASSYPTTSGICGSAPQSQDEWNRVYTGTLNVLREASIAKVVTSTYSGVLVDEYQDCTKDQHGVVLALAEILPVSVLGDPLQGIFDFGGNIPVDWELDVENSFEELPPLEVPWRWRNGSVVLGEWLSEVRQDLVSGRDVDLTKAPASAVEWIPTTKTDRISQQIGICYRMLREEYGSVAAIQDMPNQNHFIASKLRGRYQCAEANECPDLLKHAAKIENSTGADRALSVIEFVGSCLAGLKTELAGVRARLKTGNLPDARRSRKHVSVVEAVIRVAESSDIAHVEHLTAALIGLPGLPVYRREVLQDFQRGLRKLTDASDETLVTAVWGIRDISRRISRPVPRRIIGTTKLLKGLEFDTVALLDAADFRSKDLYVAVTRATSQLFVLSEHPVLSPEA